MTHPHSTSIRIRDFLRLDRELTEGGSVSDFEVLTPEEEAQARDLLQRLSEALKQPKDALAGMPERIGKYLIRQILGIGGFAIVYLGWDELMQREVAVKVPLPRVLVDQQLREKFVSEARAAAQLEHPAIVTTFEADDDGMLPYIAFARCSGPTLSDYIQQNGSVRHWIAARTVLRLADAVEYSHSKGLIHRDIKPANVLLFSTESSDNSELPFDPRLADFGLSKLLDTAAVNSNSSVIAGTPRYLAPELLERTGVKAGQAVDIFGLGSVLYEMLTGRPPFEGETVCQVLDAVKEGNIVPVPNLAPKTPPDLVAICEKCLALNPADRYRSARALKEDIQRCLDGKGVTARPLSWPIRLLRWSQQRDRIREAAGFVILSHAAMFLWIWIWPVAIMLQLPLVEGVTLQELVPYTFPIGILHLLAMAIAWPMARGSTVFAWNSCIIAGTFATFQFSVLNDFISPPYPSIYVNDRTRDIIFMLLFCIFLSQFLYCIAAVVAIARQRHASRQAS